MNALRRALLRQEQKGKRLIHLGSEPGVMTARARAYLSVAAVRHSLVGAFALAIPASFQSTSFLPLLDVAPLWVWGWFSIGCGIISTVAAIRGRLSIARAALMLSATLTAVVASSLLIAVFTGQLSSPTGPIIWIAVALKDFIQCGDPLRSPFEVLVARFAEEQEAEND